MISTETITIYINNVKREFLPSPVMLQSKEPPITKFGNIVSIYFYENWIDEDYEANLKQESLDNHFKTDDYLINYGQDFSKFYVGYLKVDFENRTIVDWEVDQNKLNETDVNLLKDSFFNSKSERRRIVIFTPTRPSDFEHGNLKYLF